MIVGCYDMHLYCAAKCEAERARDLNRRQDCVGPTSGQFTGPNEREARAQARKWAWIFAKGEAWCSPTCLKQGEPPQRNPNV